MKGTVVGGGVKIVARLTQLCLIQLVREECMEESSLVFLIRIVLTAFADAYLSFR
jgi:hypothetical protein